MKHNIPLYIVYTCLAILLILIFSFSIIEHSTDVKIVNIKDTFELYSFILTPIITAFAVYYAYKAFQEQKVINDIQTEAIKTEKERYEIDKGYEQALSFIEEMRLYKEAIIFKHSEGEEAITQFYHFIWELNDKNRLSNANDDLKQYEGKIKEFNETFSGYLQITTYTANKIIKFHDYKENSFIILHKRFFKEIGELRATIKKINDEIQTLKKDLHEYHMFHLQNIHDNAEKTYEASIELIKLTDNNNLGK